MLKLAALLTTRAFIESALKEAHELGRKLKSEDGGAAQHAIALRIDLQSALGAIDEAIREAKGAK